MTKIRVFYDWNLNRQNLRRTLQIGGRQSLRRQFVAGMFPLPIGGVADEQFGAGVDVVKLLIVVNDISDKQAGKAISRKLTEVSFFKYNIAQ